jgi:PTS system mannitol-specific IIC component
VTTDTATAFTMYSTPWCGYCHRLKSQLDREGISFVRYPNGLDWNGHQVHFVVGIAGAGDDHLALLSNLSKVFVDRDKVAQLEAARTVDEVRRILG